MTLDEAVYRYLSVARPIILRYFPVNSCIQSTRACIEVFKHFGFRAKPQAVMMVLANKATKTAFTTGLTPEAKAQAQAAVANWQDLSDGQGTDIHVIAIVEDLWFIDSSIDQAKLVLPTMDAEPFAFKMPRDFDLFANRVEIQAVSGSVPISIQYCARDEDRYLLDESWDEGVLPASTIIRAMQGESVDNDALTLYVVYKDAKDQPQFPYVVRRWQYKQGGMRFCDKQLWATCQSDGDLERLRREFRMSGLHRIERLAEDNRTILEVWI